MCQIRTRLGLGARTGCSSLLHVGIDYRTYVPSETGTDSGHPSTPAWVGIELYFRANNGRPT